MDDINGDDLNENAVDTKGSRPWWTLSLARIASCTPRH